MSNNLEYQIDYSTRFKYYKELKEMEPRIWTRNHHSVRMLTNCCIINLTMYGLFKIYYTYYIPEHGLLKSMLISNKMKILLISLFAVDCSLYYFNYAKLDEMIYGSYYSHLTNKEFYEMYESVKIAKLKNKLY